MITSPSLASPRDTNAVLADHERELLALPDVVGVYAGLTKGEKTSCIKVMLAKKNPRTQHQIPRTLEGYPVVAEITGEIRPMSGQ